MFGHIHGVEGVCSSFHTAAFLEVGLLLLWLLSMQQQQGLDVLCCWDCDRDPFWVLLWF